jgi:uncharacterized RmlC-like cupin family protein
MLELISATASGAQQVTLRLVEIPPLEPPARRHPHEHRAVEECVLVLAGRGLAWVGGDTAPLTEGDALLIPPSTPHMRLSTSGPGGDPLRVACFFPTADMPASMVEHPEIEVSDEALYARA